VKAATAERILAGLAPGGPPPPAVRAAVQGWLWFMDGALIDWIEHRDIGRPQLLGTLLGAVAAAGAPAPSRSSPGRRRRSASRSA
jgi:hypothetical protein